MELPIEKLEALARNDGLREGQRLRIRILEENEAIISPFLIKKARGSYSPGKKQIILDSSVTRNPVSFARIITHEVKHQIDMQGWPSSLVYFSYALVVISLSGAVGVLYHSVGSPWWVTTIAVLLSYVFSYYLVPWEISANVYMRRRWKDYYQAIYGKPPD